MSAVPLTAPASASEAVLAPVRAQPSGRPLGWWGMVTLIVTEAMIFALLFFVNFYLRANAPRWPLGEIKDPELVKSGIRTVLLLGSTIPMVIAERAIAKGNRKRMIGGLVVGWLMAAVFMAGHIEEYVKLAKEFTPATNAYGSIFYTLTGLHAVHLTVGMVIVVFILVRAFRGRYDADDHLPVQNTILYWHFVDAVWAVVFPSLYLSVTLL